MNTRLFLAALAVASTSTLAVAQMGGPGMMHGGGPGRMEGPGKYQAMTGVPGDCSMGGGMMGGPMGGGMMGGHMGGGMMGGPMGGGMMGGHMGGGMMGGHMGGGMMGGHWGGQGFAKLDRLNLDGEQRGKVTEARRDLQRKTHALMGSLHELRWQAEDSAKSAAFDEAAARKRYEAGAALHKQMFEARLEAHKRIRDVLTPEQREQLIR